MNIKIWWRTFERKKWNGKGYDIFGDLLYELKNGRVFIKEYYENGRLSFKGYYLNGERHGKGKEYYEDVKFEGEYF